MKDAGRRQSLQEGGTGRAVGDLAAGEREREGPAVLIGQRVGYSSCSRRASGPSDLIRGSPDVLPPFPPEAERWAFTAELSMSTWAA